MEYCIPLKTSIDRPSPREFGLLQYNIDGAPTGRGVSWHRWEQVWQEIPQLFYTQDGNFAKLKREPKAFPPVRFLELGDYCLMYSNGGIKTKFNPNPVNLVPIPRTPKTRCFVIGCKREGGNMWGICGKHTHEYEKNGKIVSGPMTKLHHFADWIGSLVNLKTKEVYTAPDHQNATGMLLDSWVKKGGDASERRARSDKLDMFMASALVSIVGKVPDSTTMQLEYEHGMNTPSDVVTIVKELDTGPLTDVTDTVDWIWNRGKTHFNEVPVRVVAGVLALGFAAVEANRGDLWFCDKVLGQPERSGYASAYMSAAYYYLRRYTGANDGQARMSVK